MAFIDWLPIGSTIKHLLQNPRGMRVSDYTCNMDNSACMGSSADIAAATTACERDIDRQLLANIQNYVGSIPDAVIHDVVGDIGSVVIAWLIKRSITRAAGLPIPAVAIVLGVDSFVDLGVVISTLNRMREAAKRAKAVCCKCHEAPCSNAKINSAQLKIERWYWGPERSFDQTRAEAQDYADINYNCNGLCATGSCRPTIYVFSWDQSHFGMTKTTLKYDVYCECR